MLIGIVSLFGLPLASCGVNELPVVASGTVHCDAWKTQVPESGTVTLMDWDINNDDEAECVSLTSRGERRQYPTTTLFPRFDFHVVISDRNGRTRPVHSSRYRPNPAPGPRPAHRPPVSRTWLKLRDEGLKNHQKAQRSATLSGFRGFPFLPDVGVRVSLSLTSGAGSGTAPEITALAQGCMDPPPVPFQKKGPFPNPFSIPKNN